VNLCTKRFRGNVMQAAVDPQCSCQHLPVCGRRVRFIRVEEATSAAPTSKSLPQLGEGGGFDIAAREIKDVMTLIVDYIDRKPRRAQGEIR
jgi:hypothetical protein